MNKGYFRLVGRIGDDPETQEDIDSIVKQIPFTLGRNESSNSHLCLGGQNNAISREHARIYWDEESSEYMIEILGKNKCAVDKELRSKGDKIKLSSKSTLRFSTVRLYFLLPDPEPAASSPVPPVALRETSIADTVTDGRQKGYSEYVSMAFDAIGAEKPLSAKNIIDWANSTFPEVREQKRVNLYQGVYTALKRKYERLEDTVGDRNGYLWRKKVNHGDVMHTIEDGLDDAHGN